MTQKSITIEKLQIGMYIVGLDIPWIKSPFLTHSIRIKSHSDIQKVKRSGAKLITIDIKKGRDIGEMIGSDATISKTKAANPLRNQPDLQSKTVLSKNETQHGVAFTQELNIAKDIKNKSLAVGSKTNDNVRHNKPIQASPITPIIQTTLANLSRNDQGLIALLHLDTGCEKLLAHLFNTFSLSLALAVRLNLSEEKKQTLGLAAFVHDAAWTKLPANLFATGKPYSEDAEQRLQEQHIEIICNLLSRSEGFPPEVIDIIRQHHELIDGSGFPDNLRSKDILYSSQILAVADKYDELIHGLAGYPGMLPKNARCHLYRIAQDGKINIEIVSQLVNIVGVYPIYSAVLLSTGEKAIVIGNNSEHPLKPWVKLCYSAEGHSYKSSPIIDLSNRHLYLGHILEIIDPSSPNVDPHNLLSDTGSICSSFLLNNENDSQLATHNQGQ